MLVYQRVKQFESSSSLFGSIWDDPSLTDRSGPTGPSSCVFVNVAMPPKVLFHGIFPIGNTDPWENLLDILHLVGGDWNHGNFMTFPSYWECHHPNWRSLTHIFQRGRWLNHQPVIHWTHLEMGVHQFDDLPIQSHRFFFSGFPELAMFDDTIFLYFHMVLPTNMYLHVSWGFAMIFHDFPMVFQLWTTISHADFLSFPIFFIWFPIKSTVKA